MLMGCSDEKVTFDDLILGLWVNTHVNDQPVLTDEAFVCDYRADLTQLYAIVLALDEENNSWIENTAYTCIVNDKSENIFYTAT